MSSLERPTPPRTLDDALVQIEDLRTLVGHLVEHAEKLQARNEELTAQVEQLLDQAGKSSKNSSKSPSTDSDAQRAGRKKKRSSERRQGAQEGHPKHERALVPEADVDEVRRYFPAGRCECGGSVCVDAEPTRHQVADIPPTPATVTEHQLFGGRCEGCARRCRVRFRADRWARGW